MGLNIEYILRRATQTHACAKVILEDITDTWEWSECTVAAYKLKLDAANDLVEAKGDEAADAASARGELLTNVNTLMDKAGSYLSLAKRKYRNDDAKMILLRPLRVHNMSLAKKLKLAMDVENAWKQIDQTYVPMTGDTFAAFQTLRGTCQTKYENVSKEDAEEGEAGGEVYKALKELHRLSVDWYQEAIRRFGPETPHGILIRDTIDTAPGAPTPVPDKATMTGNWDAEITKVVLIFAALHATSFQMMRSDDGGTSWNDYGTATSPSQYGDMAPGTYLYRVRGINSMGEGEWSDSVEVVVP